MKKPLMFLLLGMQTISCRTESDANANLLDSNVSQSESSAILLAKFCATAESSIGQKVREEFEVICQGSGQAAKGTELGVQLVDNAYDGSNDSALAMKQLKLNSSNNQTQLLFAGGIKVNKNLFNVERIREKILTFGIDDPKNNIAVNREITKLKPDQKIAEGECYLVKESTTSIGGVDKVVGKECFLELDPRIVASYQTMVPGDADNNDNGVNNSILVHLEINPGQTVLLAVLHKSVDNHGLAAFAEDLIKTQPAAFILNFWDMMRRAPSYVTVKPNAMAEDNNPAGQYAGLGDWSWGRTKLSCPQNIAAYGVNQVSLVDGGKLPIPKGTLAINCGVPMVAQSYRYQESPKGVPLNYDLKCEDDEYVAGISFFRYNDHVSITIDSPKSLLCAKKSAVQQTSACSERRDKCHDDEYLQGLNLNKESGFICAGQRADDAGKGCYTTQKLYCCNVMH